MPEYILFMHGDADDEVASSAWELYLEGLSSAGVFRGGSAIGSGICVRRGGAVPMTTDHVVGFVRIDARDLEHAQELLAGNPVFEAGGTVEIRELPRTD